MVMCMRAKFHSQIEKHSVESMPQLPIKIMVNVGNPDRAFDFPTFAQCTVLALHV